MENNKISVLHTIEDLKLTSGGPTRTVLGLVTALSKIDIDVFLATQNLLHEEYLSPKNIKIFETYAYKYSIFKKLGTSFKNGITYLIKKNNPMILHSHGIWLASNYWTSRAASTFNLPHIIHTRGMLSSWSLSNKKLKKQAALLLYQKKNLINANVLIATSKLEYKDIRSLGLTNPVAIIPNGVNFEKIKNHSHNLSDKKHIKNVLFLSRIQKKKGLVNLLYAWEKIRPQCWRLQIAGSNEEGHLDEIKILAKKLKINEQIDYLGYVDNELKNKIYQQSSLFVLPSFSENFGVVIAEAMSFGLPVITTTGTPWEDLNKYKCGWHIDIGIDHLVNALKQAFALSDNERRIMGEKSREYIKRFNWNIIARDMRLTYLWTLKKIKKPSFIELS